MSSVLYISWRYAQDSLINWTYLKFCSWASAEIRVQIHWFNNKGTKLGTELSSITGKMSSLEYSMQELSNH